MEVEREAIKEADPITLTLPAKETVPILPPPQEPVLSSVRDGEGEGVPPTPAREWVGNTDTVLGWVEAMGEVEGDPEGLLLAAGLPEAKGDTVKLGLVDGEAEREGVLLPDRVALGEMEGVALGQVDREGGKGVEDVQKDLAPV